MKIGDRALFAMTFCVMLGALWSMTKALGDWYDYHYLAVHRAEPPDAPLLWLETKLRPLATPKKPPGPHDWLKSHDEFGQTFAEYRRAEPVRTDATRKTIWIMLVGDFSPEQRKILEETRLYMELFYGLPVMMGEEIPVAKLPPRALRIHPEQGNEQLLAGYVLNEILAKKIPHDAVAFLAFTSKDLTPGAGWNYVFGQANLYNRTGVWSIARFGDPRGGAKFYQDCLRRTMSVATHETGHIFTIQHCTAFECNMNGANNLPESDRAPLSFCPVCTRKLCWNVGLDPIKRFEALQTFYEKHDMMDDAGTCRRMIAELKKP